MKTNIANKKFGMLTVIKEVEKPISSNYSHWLCRCECGNEKVFSRKNLGENRTRSCGCLVGKWTKDFINKKFGMLTVVKKIRSYSKQKKTQWLCKCNCGNEKIITGDHLGEDGTKSCGCLVITKNKELGKKRRGKTNKVKDLSGHTFGRLTVVKRVLPEEYESYLYIKKIKYNTVWWLCKCNCGNESVVSGNALVRKNKGTKSCGCLSLEIHSGKNSKWWTGGIKNHKQGYIYIRKKNHLNANKQGWILEHQYVMSEAIGRSIKKEETIHHKNGIRNDNRLDNLELWSSRHPRGQRVEDMISFCKDYLSSYEQEILKLKEIKSNEK